MKQKLSLILVMLLSVNLLAQIEFTNEDLAPEGTTFYISGDTIPNQNISIGIPGPDRTWDFSNLIEHDVDTIIFNLPDWTPYPDEFPDANFAIESLSDLGFVYLIRNDDEFSGIGAVGPFEEFGILSAPLEPKEIVYDFPEQYGNSRDEIFSIEVTVETSTPWIDSIRIKKATEKNSFVDAWGTMILPLGTFETIRVKEARHEYDTIWGKSFGNWVLISSEEREKTTYIWLTDNPTIGYTLVSLDYNTDNFEVKGVDFINVIPVGIVKETITQTKAFPNPAFNFINIEFENINQGSLSIFDISGNKIEQKFITSNNHLTLNLSNYKSGLYFYLITTTEGEISGRGKFIKN